MFGAYGAKKVSTRIDGKERTMSAAEVYEVSDLNNSFLSSFLSFDSVSFSLMFQ